MKTILPLLLLLFISCNRSEQLSEPAQMAEVQHLVCEADSSCAYALYLPSAYTSDRSWPVVFAFDPQGQGQIPVDSLARAAEQYGFIICGSTSWETGLSGVQQLVENLFQDIFSRYNVDRSRLYTAGFSGGGRLASLVATHRMGISGVISCAAGLPGIDISQLDNRFYFYGIVGNRDFNYPEFVPLMDGKQTDLFRYVVRVFDGSHQWPPAELMGEALLYFHLRSMADGKIARDRRLIRQQRETLKKDIEATTNPYKAATICQRAIRTYEGLGSVSWFEKKQDELMQNEEYERIHARKKLVHSVEERLREQSAAAFEMQDYHWWEHNFENIQKAIRESDEEENRLAFERTVNYFSILAYTYTSKALLEGDLEKARKYIDIYKLVDPENPDIYSFEAQLE